MLAGMEVRTISPGNSGCAVPPIRSCWLTALVSAALQPLSGKFYTYFNTKVSRHHGWR